MNADSDRRHPYASTESSVPGADFSTTEASDHSCHDDHDRRSKTNAVSSTVDKGANSNGWHSGADGLPMESTQSVSTPLLPLASRELCVRHQRMADEGTTLKLQKSIESLPLADQQAVNTVWTLFSSSPHRRRSIILQGLLTICCFSQLSFLSQELALAIRIDPFSLFPREISLKVLGYLDAISLGRAAQVSRGWKELADDDLLWRNMCEQHIERKCQKCGWGLPLLEKKRRLRTPAGATVPITAGYRQFSDGLLPSGASTPVDGAGPGSVKRIVTAAANAAAHARSAAANGTTAMEASSPSAAVAAGVNGEGVVVDAPPAKRHCSSSSRAGSSRPASRAVSPSGHVGSRNISPSARSSSSMVLAGTATPPPPLTRPWKDVYCERLLLERNWRRGRYTLRTLKGHTDGIMCLQFSEQLLHPCFPILITGSYDRTARVWNLETGEVLRVLKGHTRGVRCLQFDEAKLITGSMDRTLKIWNWRTGDLIRTLEGHTDGIVCLHFDGNTLVSGSADSTIKVWNFRTGECYTLRGHRDWVNAVTIWAGPSCGSSSSGAHVKDAGGSSLGTANGVEGHPSSSSSMLDHRASSLGPRTRPSRSLSPISTMDQDVPPASTSQSSAAGAGSSTSIPPSSPDKFLFSASDDGTIRLWDLAKRECLLVYEGHVGQVQSIRVVMVERHQEDMGGGREGESESGSRSGRRGKKGKQVATDGGGAGVGDSGLGGWEARSLRPDYFSPDPSEHFAFDGGDVPAMASLSSSTSPPSFSSVTTSAGANANGCSVIPAGGPLAQSSMGGSAATSSTFAGPPYYGSSLNSDLLSTFARSDDLSSGSSGQQNGGFGDGGGGGGVRRSGSGSPSATGTSSDDPRFNPVLARVHARLYPQKAGLAGGRCSTQQRPQQQAHPSLSMNYDRSSTLGAREDWEMSDGEGQELDEEGAEEEEEEEEEAEAEAEEETGPIPILISGSLDNTIKVWDVRTGRCLRTLFGHVEGVWAIDVDKLRLVSASHDRTIKVWDKDSGRCLNTLVGHRGAVTCVALGDDKILSGSSDDGDVRIWSFAP